MDDEYRNAIARCYIVMMNKDCKGSTWSDSSFKYGEEITLRYTSCSAISIHDTEIACHSCMGYIEEYKDIYLKYRKVVDGEKELKNIAKKLKKRIH